MKKHYIFLLLLLCFAGWKTSYAQTVFYTESFETDGEGSRYTSNTFSDCPSPNFFLRTNTNPVTPPSCTGGFSSTLVLSPLQGTFFWAGEDIAGPLPPGSITSQGINIAGQTAMTISLYIACSNNSGTIWETGDSLNIQVNIDGGGFNTVGRFIGNNNFGGNLAMDSNLDGAITAADNGVLADQTTFAKYTFTIPGTGSSMQFNIDFDINGGSEEIAIDLIEVSGVAGPSTGEINLVGNGQNISDGDMSPTSSDHTAFANVLTCSGTTSRTFTIQNTASPTLNLTGSPRVQVSGANAADFTVTSQPAATVAGPGGATTFTVQFDPSANGTRNAILTIANDDSDENPYDFAIRGVGLNDNIAPTVVCPAAQSEPVNTSCQVSLPDYTSLVTTSDNCPGAVTLTQSPSPGSIVSGVGTSISVSMIGRDGSLNASTCTFITTLTGSEINVQGNGTNISDGDSSPTTTDHTDFGSVLACSGTIVRTFTIQNTGSAVLNVSGAAISGANAADFTVTSAPAATVAIGGTTTVEVTFDPSATGLRNATLTINNDDCDETAYDFAIRGNGSADNISPTVTCPGNQSEPVNTSCQVSLPDYTSLVTTSDNCPGAVTLTQSPSVGTIVSGVGTSISVSMVGRDGSLNASSCTFITTLTGSEINLQGNSSNIADGSTTPSAANHTDFGSVLTCSGTIVRTYTIQNTGSAVLNVSGAAISGTNAADFTVTSAPAATVAIGGSTTFDVTFDPSATGLRSATVTVNNDDCDETAYDFAIQGNGDVDLIPPVITCPSNVTAHTGAANCTAVVTYPAPTGTDNCAVVGGAQIAGLSSGSTFNGGVTTNTFTAVDAAGNADTCSFTVTVLDSISPTLTCPANLSVSTDSNTCDAIVTYSPPVGTDNCGVPTGSQTGGIGSGLTFPIGVTTNSFLATDGSGNSASCSFTVTVADSIAPTIICPGNITVTTSSATCDTVLTYAAAATSDNCGIASTSQSAGLASGATFPVGTTTNTFVVMDSAGNSANCSFTVDVSENVPPSITCPSNITAHVSPSSCDAVVTYTTPVGTDNCGSATTVQSTGLASGATFPLGITTNTFDVSDSASNINSCSFTVTVLDTLLPTIVCPANITTSTSASTCDTLVNYSTPIGSDNCSGATTTQSSGLASGLAFPLGTTTNTFVVTDSSNNVDSCSFTITVNDNTAPSISCPSNITTSTSSASCDAVVSYSAPVGTDNCSGASTTQSAGLASGATYPLGTTTNSFVVTDGASNVDSCSFTVTVIDSVAPTITCPGNVSAFTGPANCTSVVSFSAPSGTDNCSGASTTQTAGLASGSTYSLGMMTHTFVVTDGVGNMDSCSFVVTVSDTILPTITCPANMTVSNDPGNCDAVVVFTSPVGTDNCGVPTLTQTAGLSTGATFPLGTTMNSFTVTDSSFNAASCSFSVTVNDTEGPTVTCQSTFTTYVDQNGDASITMGDVFISATDNCAMGGPTTLSDSTFDCGSLGANGVTITAIDSAGNTGTCVTQVSVLDTISPSVLCMNDTLNLGSNGTVALNITGIDGGSTDNCGSPTLSATPMSFNGSNLGTNSVTLTATDGSGNTSSCTAQVFVTDSLGTGIATPPEMGISMVASPNPAHDRLRVKLTCESCFQGDELQLEMWNMLGQKVKSIQLESLSQTQTIELDLNGLPAGNYLLSLRHNDQVMTRKVLKN